MRHRWWRVQQPRSALNFECAIYWYFEFSFFHIFDSFHLDMHFAFHASFFTFQKFSFFTYTCNNFHIFFIFDTSSLFNLTFHIPCFQFFNILHFHLISLLAGSRSGSSSEWCPQVVCHRDTNTKRTIR